MQSQLSVGQLVLLHHVTVAREIEIVLPCDSGCVVLIVGRRTQCSRDRLRNLDVASSVELSQICLNSERRFSRFPGNHPNVGNRASGVIEKHQSTGAEINVPQRHRHLIERSKEVICRKRAVGEVHLYHRVAVVRPTGIGVEGTVSRDYVDVAVFVGG